MRIDEENSHVIVPQTCGDQTHSRIQQLLHVCNRGYGVVKFSNRLELLGALCQFVRAFGDPSFQRALGRAQVLADLPGTGQALVHAVHAQVGDETGCSDQHQ